MEASTRVRNKETGKCGVVVRDSFGCCDDNEEAVVYDGTKAFLGTDRKLLEVLPDVQQVPDPMRCGAGRGDECCIFLTLGAGGFSCDRFTSLRDALIFRTMTAKRNPVESYPGCMKFLKEE